MQNGAEVITSRQNPLLVLTAKLTDKKHREREGLFRFDGKKLFLEALAGDLPLFAVLIRESSAPAFLDLALERAKASALRVAVLPDALFERMSEEKAPEGVICICRYLTQVHGRLTIGEGDGADPFAGYGRVLLLESVRDPGNLGTILRSSRAFGVDLVALSDDCADVYNSRTVRAAMGALFKTPTMRVSDAVGAVSRAAAHRRVFAAALDERAEILGSFPIQAGDCVVIGNEGHGLTAETIQACDTCVMIPMTNRAESFNAAVAASLLMWEFARR